MGSTLQTYFCEFCCTNFCTNCTLREAHDENYDKITNIISCKQIHLQTQNTNEIEDDEEVDMVTVDHVDEKSVTVENVYVKDHPARKILNVMIVRNIFAKTVLLVQLD